MLMGHDPSYVVLDPDGTPLLIAEEERYSRVKRGRFVPPPQFALRVLAEAGVDPTEVGQLAICNLPDLIELRESHTLDGLPRFDQARISDALLRVITPAFRRLKSTMHLRHHLCHAASAFLPSPFKRAVVLTIDGMGELETAAIWIAEGTDLRQVHSVPHPHSLGYLYQAVAQWMGLSGGEREGKLMGLAATGDARLLGSFNEHFLRLHPDGWRLAPALAALPAVGSAWAAHCERILGPKRSSDQPLTDYHRDVAASVQRLVEDAVLHYAALAVRLTGERGAACLAGGVFMNTVANGRLRASGMFRELWAQPMASDNGLALGAALLAHAGTHPRQERWRMTSPYLGSEITDAQVEALLRRDPVRAWLVEHAIACCRPDDMASEVADLLGAGNLVGWARGRAEVGARGLGHRSLFANPRAPDIRDRLNRLVKLREDWRPFAPMVRYDEVAKLFETAERSTYMMFVAQARSGAPIRAALHVDGSGRLQTIEADGDPDLLALLDAFAARTGVAALINTSLNTRGEPIARTADEAFAVFQRSGMDALVLGSVLLRRGPNSPPSVAPAGPPPRPIDVAPEVIAAAARGVGSSAVLSVAADEAARAVVSAVADACGTAPRLIHARRESLTADWRSGVDDAEITDARVIVVVLPVWVAAAPELMPGLLSSLAILLAGAGSPTVLLADEQGGWADLAMLATSEKRPGLGGFAAPSETFWLARLDSGSAQ
jgi:carbamoyltransferase